MHVGARYYDPKIGRFATRDTFLDQKPYLYCEGDPVNAVDPSGHQVPPKIKIVWTQFPFLGLLPIPIPDIPRKHIPLGSIVVKVGHDDKGDNGSIEIGIGNGKISIGGGHGRKTTTTFTFTFQFGSKPN